jgi:hypothetical protein
MVLPDACGEGLLASLEEAGRALARQPARASPAPSGWFEIAATYSRPVGENAPDHRNNASAIVSAQGVEIRHELFGLESRCCPPAVVVVP